MNKKAIGLFKRKKGTIKNIILENSGPLLLIAGALSNPVFAFNNELWVTYTLYLAAIFFIFLPRVLKYKKEKHYLRMSIMLLSMGLLMAGFMVKTAPLNYTLAGSALAPLLLLFILEKRSKIKEEKAKQIP